MFDAQMAFLVLVISAFTLYGVVLAWAAWWTRGAPPEHITARQARRAANRLRHPSSATSQPAGGAV